MPIQVKIASGELDCMEVFLLTSLQISAEL